MQAVFVALILKLKNMSKFEPQDIDKKAPSPVTPTFCALAWDHVATTPSGTYRVCCNSDPKNNKLQDPGGGYFKFQKADLSDLHTSPTLQDIRRQMLAGQWHETCIKCKRQEDAGILSSRQVYNHLWYDQNLSYEQDDPIRPRYADLRLSNFCNLRCRMCNPYSSHLWVDEWEKLYGKDVFAEGEADWLKTMDWPDLDKSRRILRNIVENADMLYFTGGEPTILPAHQYIIGWAVRKGHSQRISLKYNTNLTNVPVKLMHYWRKFKEIRFNLSIDGIGELNDYIRYPSKWKSIKKNYERILTLNDGELHDGVTPLAYVDVHVTIQNTNILRLDETLEYFLPGNWSGDWKGNHVFLNVLHHPEHHNIKALPLELKKAVAAKLEHRFEDPRLAQLKNVVEYMMADDWSHLFPRYLDETRRLDEMRGQNILDVMPEFMPYV